MNRSLEKRLQKLEASITEPDENFFAMKLLRKEGYEGETLREGKALNQLVETFRIEYPPENYQPPE